VLPAVESLLDRAYGLFAPFFLQRDRRFRKYKIGVGTYGKPVVFEWGEGASLSIGKYCSFGPRVSILLGGEHHFSWISTYPFNRIFSDCSHLQGHPYSKGDVVIGNDVWIGAGATILSGVTIGNGAIVGAGSIVRKDVPSYSVVAGNPAELVFHRFDSETTRRLNSIAWWNWEEQQIKAIAGLLMSNRITEFLAVASAPPPQGQSVNPSIR
jgi:virginiamycin A acetyltransferase